jgi:gluconokinase
MVIVVMGVSGSGKTTVGRALAARLDASFVEGDDLHPESNVRKMRSGVPLTDDDRWAWLARVRAEIERLLAAGRVGVVACSALRRRYRDVLRELGEGVVFVYLRGERDVIRERVEGRTGSHFMPASLVGSQFETLEEPGADEGALTVEIERRSSEEIVGEIVGRLGEGRG